MCGIMGYVGDKETQRVLTEGLRKLEYRGYDSVGIALNNGETLQHEKSKGRLEVLEEKLEGAPLSGSIGIGHTRWATHGARQMRIPIRIWMRNQNLLSSITASSRIIWK